MYRHLFCFLLIPILSLDIWAQEPNLDRSLKPIKEGRSIDTTITSYNPKSKGIKNEKAKIEDYNIISHSRDTTYVDTTLSIQKEYKFNYLRKDNFNLIQFSNIGQTYNTLSESFFNNKTMPAFGARARHFNYMQLEDISY
jgi:hypothetical protein